MIEVPLLDESDLQQELLHIHRYKHRTLTTALYAKGANQELSVSLGGGDRIFVAAPVHCELDVRRALAEKRGDRELLLLLDYDADRLPADLQGRLANGRVYSVDRSRRLARLFGATAVSSEVLANQTLCKLLLSNGRTVPAGTFSGATVDRQAAWRWLLDQVANYPYRGELTAERLLEHAVLVAPSSGLAASVGPGAAISSDLSTYLATTAGRVAPVIFKSWLSGRAREAAALAFVLEVSAKQLTESSGLRATVVTRLQGLDPSLTSAPQTDPELLLQWGELAERLWRRLHTEPTDAKREAARAILGRASELVPDPEIAALLSESKYLPVAWEVTQQRLARALQVAEKDPKPATLDAARDELERLELHVNKDAESTLVARSRMALRLIAYLVARPALEAAFGTHGSAYGMTFDLPAHYISHGAFVDHARERSAGPVNTELERAIESVRERIAGVLEVDDAAFAKAYAAWLSSGSATSAHVVPIHQGLDHFAARFLEGKTHHKVLVLLLDGMSWPNAVELLQDAEKQGFAPLRYHAGKFTPMLAALPSLTGVSRSALFGGKPIKAGETLDTGKDPQRFATHAGLRKVGLENARLYLKDEVATPTGDLNQKVFELVHSNDRIVGVVVNAIDDQLKGALQLHVFADFEHIKPLGRLLKEATRANRAILLIADHGHVRRERMNSVGRPGDGKRYRYVLEGEPTQSHEVIVSKEHGYVERGKSKVALLYRDCDSYGTASTSGEHGGASLAEVVTPALLIGSEDLRRNVEVAEGIDDGELDVAPFPRPDWWELQTPSKLKLRAKTGSGQVKAVKPAPPPKQVVLPFTVSPEATAAPPAAAAVDEESHWLKRLRASKAFADRGSAELALFRQQIAPRIALLADAGGALPAEQFARKALVLPRNVAGAVSEMQEWVNFDGYLIVEHNPIARRVTLKLDLLDQYLKEFG